MDSPGTVLITGGTGTLGFEAAKAIGAAGDRHMVLTGRDEAAARTAAERITAATGAPATGLALDLASLADVRRFAAELPTRRLPPLESIVCNAGIQVVRGISFTADGFETTFAVNHLAHFLLVNLLLPELTDAGRIVLVASDTHDPKRLTGMPAPSDPNGASLARPPRTDTESATTAGRRRYTTSKLCNVLTAYELARRFDRVRVNAFDPGLMPGTGLAREYGRVQAFGWRYLLPALTVLPGLNAHTPRRSAAALARLVTDPEFAATTGKYFSAGRETRSSEQSYDRAAAAELWSSSEKLLAE